MSTTTNRYRGFRFPAEIIKQAVWLYHCFSLSRREVELFLAARGVVVSHETIRKWSLRFGRTYANTLKRRRSQPADEWFLDEVFVRIRGKLHYLWRAVDQQRECARCAGPEPTEHESGHALLSQVADGFVLRVQGWS